MHTESTSRVEAEITGYYPFLMSRGKRKSEMRWGTKTRFELRLYLETLLRATNYENIEDSSNQFDCPPTLSTKALIGVDHLSHKLLSEHGNTSLPSLLCQLHPPASRINPRCMGLQHHCSLPAFRLLLVTAGDQIYHGHAIRSV